MPEDLDAKTAEQLRKLATMRDRGDLTDAEFATAKKRLLNQLQVLTRADLVVPARCARRGRCRHC